MQIHSWGFILIASVAFAAAAIEFPLIPLCLGAVINIQYCGPDFSSIALSKSGIDFVILSFTVMGLQNAAI